MDAYIAVVITNSRKVVWKNLLDHLSEYFDRLLGVDWKEKDGFFRKFEGELKSIKKDRN